MENIELSLKEFKQLSCAQISSLEKIVSGLNFNPIQLTAQISGLSKSRNNADSRTNNKDKLYSLSLSDGNTTLEAISEVNILDGIQENDVVNLVCFCQFTLGFNHETIKIVANIIQATSINKKRLVSEIDYTALILKKLKNTFHHFPQHKNPSVSIIYSNSSMATVNVDFLDSLKPQQQYLNINEIPINLSQPSILVEAIKNIKSDILVIIRGGGDENAMKNFDQPEVLEAFAVCKAYRIVGIGHSINHNLINLLADYSAITPTAAGTHLKNQLIERFKLNSNINILNKLVDKQNDEINQLKNNLKENQLSTECLNQLLFDLSNQQNQLLKLNSSQIVNNKNILTLITIIVIAMFVVIYLMFNH